MTNVEFNKIVSERVRMIKAILQAKAKEYASSDDRLHNFKIAARIVNTSTERALFGMFLKHLVSIIDMVYDDKNESLSAKYIDEKIGDAINYLILLEAVLKEDLK